MIVKVAVDRKTGGEDLFDYQTQTDQDLSGFLLRVPFSAKKILAIAIKNAKTSRYSLKPIVKVLSLGKIITQEQLVLARKIADYYLSSFPNTIFSFLPNFNIKDIKSLGVAKYKITKPSDGNKMYFFGSWWERIGLFLQQISKQEGQHLVILPDMKQFTSIRNKIISILPGVEIRSWHSLLESKEKAVIWQKLLEGKPLIIIGTRQSLLLPFTKLKNIYLEDQLNFAYHEDQAPYYNAYKVADFLKETYGANLMIGSDSPDLISYIDIHKNKFEVFDNIKQISADFLDESNFFKGMLTVDMASWIKEGKKILILTSGSKYQNYHCKNCKAQINCHKCSGSIYENDKCINCHTPLNPVCSFCSGVVDQNKNLSSSNIKNILDHDNKITGQKIKTLPNFVPAEDSICIASFFEVDKIVHQFDICVLVGYSYLKQIPRTNILAKIFSVVQKLRNKGVNKFIILHTQGEEDSFDFDLKNGNWEKIFKQELIDRKNNQIFPYQKGLVFVCKTSKEDEFLKKLDQFLLLDKNIKVMGEKKEKNKFKAFLNLNYEGFEKIKPAIKEMKIASCHVEIDPLEFFN